MSKKNIQLVREDFDFEAFKEEWEQLSEEDKQYYLNVESETITHRSRTKKYTPLVLQAIGDQFPFVDVFEFLWEKADKNQQRKMLEKIGNLDSWYSLFSFAEQKYKQPEKEAAFISVISKVIALNNDRITKNYKDKIYNLSYADSVFEQKYGPESGHALFEFILDAAQNKNIDDAILAFYLDALSIGVGYHYDRLNQFRFVLEGDELPQSKAIFESVDVKYINGFETEYSAFDFLLILKTKTHLDSEKSYFQFMIEQGRIETLVGIVKQCAKAFKVNLLGSEEELLEYEDEIFGTTAVRESYPPQLRKALSSIFSVGMDKEKKQEIEEEESEKFYTRENWPDYKQKLLGNLFEQNEVNADFERALDHLARHARLYLDTQSKTSRAKLGRRKLVGLKELFDGFQDIISEQGTPTERLAGIKEKIAQYLENNDGSEVWMNRGGFFGAYRAFGHVMDKLHRPHYGMQSKGEERTTARSRTEHYLIELFDAASSELEKGSDEESSASML